MSVFISCINFVIGEQKTLRSIDALNRNEPLYTHFVSDGFYSFSSSASNPVEMALGAVTKTLYDSKLHPDSIDAIVFVTESFSSIVDDLHPTNGDQFRLMRDGLISNVISRSKLNKARIYGLNMLACGNLTSALGVAYGLVCSEIHKNVLVVMSDRCGGNQFRIIKGNLGILSDASCACIVSQTGSIRIKSIIGTNIKTSDSDIPTEGFLQDALAVYNACKHLSCVAHHKFGLKLEDIPYIFADNIHLSYYAIACEGLGIPPGNLLFPTKREIGHTFSSDCLIGLKHAHSLEFSDKCRHIGLLNIGSTSLGFVLLAVI